MKRNKLRNQVVKGLAYGLVMSLALISGNSTAKVGAFDGNFELKKQLLEVEIPPLPSLGDSSLYLYKPDDVFNLKVVIRLSKRQVFVYRNDNLIANYPIAVGKKGWETPQGNFSIIQMIENPSWQNPWSGKVIPPGPNNPLGTRWIGFWSDGKNFIGFHGTPGEHLIGQAVSHGCVRMKDTDVRALFELVAVGTPVIVEP
jgi:hypothetical protein